MKGYEFTVYLGPGCSHADLRAFGGRRTLTWWTGARVFRAADDRALAALLMKLRDAGVAFLGAGPDLHAGWVFEAFREQGLVSGPYKRLAFVGPGRWRVDEA